MHYHTPIALEFLRSIPGAIVDILVAPDQSLAALPDNCKYRYVTDSFHAAWSKHRHYAPWLQAQAPMWVLFTDADIAFNPRDSERIAHILGFLEHTKSLIGLCGRRITSNFVTNYKHSPSLRISKYSEPLGFFQLYFSERNDPPTANGPNDTWGVAHDDNMLASAYSASNLLSLPFACYHVGDTDQTWKPHVWLRTANAPQPQWNRNQIPPELYPFLINTNVLLSGLHGGSDATWLAGIPDIGCIYVHDPWELNQTPVERVEDLPLHLTGIPGWLPGQWRECNDLRLAGLPAPPLSECVTQEFLRVIAADRAFTRARFLREASGKRVVILGDNVQTAFQELAGTAVGVIWMSGEIGYSSLLGTLSSYVRCLSVEAPFVCTVIGAYYDIVVWPESTGCISLLLGDPDLVVAGGYWVKHLSIPPSQQIATFPLPPPWPCCMELPSLDASVGVLLYNDDYSPGAIDAMIFTLHTIREFWRGPIAVLYNLTESPSLRIACARYAASYIEVSVSVQEFYLTLKSHGGAVARPSFIPFEEAFWIEAGRAVHPPDLLSSGVGRIHWIPLEDGVRCELTELEVLRAWASNVKVRDSATVVIGLLEDDLLAFRRNWASISWIRAYFESNESYRLAVNVPIAIVGCGVSEDVIRQNISNPPLERSVAVHAVAAPNLATEIYAEPHWTGALGCAAGHCDTEWLIYLDPSLYPSPGAELFLPSRLGSSAVIASAWAFRRINLMEYEWFQRIFSITNAILPPALRIGGILRHLQFGSPATLIRSKLFESAYQNWISEFVDIPFEIFLTLMCIRESIPMEVHDVFQTGWRR